MLFVFLVFGAASPVFAQEAAAAAAGAGLVQWSIITAGFALAIAAAGGGLLVYGIRSSGRTRQIATTAGAALVARGLTGKPFEGLGDLMNPAKAFGF